MLITILTPTYNRAYTLTRLYKSLAIQSCKEFIWLVLDDGSTDNTEILIKELKQDATFEIRYIKKKNGGKHTAINEGVKEINTILTFIVDSDDYITEDAIETINIMWNKYKSIPQLSGIWFLNKDPNGKVIGDYFPQEEFISDYTRTIINAKICGDKSVVYCNLKNHLL